MIELSPKERLGWSLFVVATALAVVVANAAGGLMGGLGALSTALYTAAGVLGVSVARTTQGQGGRQ